jgi:hypothetical protein
MAKSMKLSSNAAQALLMYIRSNVDKQFGDVVDQLVQHRTDTLCVGQPDDGPYILCHLQDICCPRTEIKRREAQCNWELYSISNNLGIMAHYAEFNRLYQTFKHRGGVISSDEIVKQYFTSIYHVEERLLSQHVSRLYGEYEQDPASMSLFIIQAKMRDKEQEIQTNALAHSKYGPSVKSSRANHAESKTVNPKRAMKRNLLPMAKHGIHPKSHAGDATKLGIIWLIVAALLRMKKNQLPRSVSMNTRKTRKPHPPLTSKLATQQSHIRLLLPWLSSIKLKRIWPLRLAIVVTVNSQSQK